MDADHLVAPADDGRRLVDIVRDRLVVVARRGVGPLIADGGVLVDGRVGSIDQQVATGSSLRLADGRLSTLHDDHQLCKPVDGSRVPGFAIAHCDPDVLVVDKPHGMHMAPMGNHRDGTLQGALCWLAGARPGQPWGDWRPHPGHRLDRATSGLVAVLTSPAMHRSFQSALASGLVERRYRATVTGHPTTDRGTIDTPLGRDPRLDYRRAVVGVEDGGQPARTHWTVVARGADTTELELQLDTGRTHQIRAHLASIGHPVVGDDLYAVGASRQDATSRIALRACLLTFPHPRTGRSVRVVT